MKSKYICENVRNLVVIDALLRTVRVFCTDIGIEFRVKKCEILFTKRVKVVRCEGIKLPNSEAMKEVEKDLIS